MKHLISFVYMLNRFEVMHFQLMAVLENWRFLRHLFRGWGGKNRKEVISLDTTPMLCANFVAIRRGTAEIDYLESQGL